MKIPARPPGSAAVRGGAARAPAGARQRLEGGRVEHVELPHERGIEGFETLIFRVDRSRAI